MTFEGLIDWMEKNDRQTIFKDCRKNSRLTISGGPGIGHKVFHLITFNINHKYYSPHLLYRPHQVYCPHNQ